MVTKMGSITKNETELLNRAWKYYTNIVAPGRLNQATWSNYSWVYRKTKYAQRFEDWLFAQGAVIKQIDRRRVLEFFDEKQKIIFILKYLS